MAVLDLAGLNQQTVSYVTNFGQANGKNLSIYDATTLAPMGDIDVPGIVVESIFNAKPGDYRKATDRVYHSPDHATFVELPVVQGSQ